MALQHTYPLINRKSSAGTFRWLCESYFVSPEFIQLDPRTRRIRRNKLEELCINLGDLPIKGIAPKHIRAIRNAHQDRPEAANSILKIMRQLLTYAIDLDLLTHNPAKEVKYLPSLNSSGFHTWTEEEIAKYEAYHLIGSPALLAMALMLYTGQRKSDAVELGRQHLKEIDGKWKLCFSQKKNQRRKKVSLQIPVHPKLKAIIDASTTGHLQFIISTWGKPFTPESFGNRFRKWCDAAGLPHCSSHGLRKAAAVRLAEAGCTPSEIAAITGHSSLKQVYAYSKGASQARLAESAMARLYMDQIRNEKVPPFDEMVKSGTISDSNPLMNKG